MFLLEWGGGSLFDCLFPFPLILFYQFFGLLSTSFYIFLLFIPLVPGGAVYMCAAEVEKAAVRTGTCAQAVFKKFRSPSMGIFFKYGGYCLLFVREIEVDFSQYLIRLYEGAAIYIPV